jgi:hypothetical protein
MPETITISFSQIANQLTTHFNNLQDERFHQDPTNLDNLTHILPKATYGSKFISNLYPRSILYDYANGTGALDPFMFFEPNPIESLNLNSFQRIQTSPELSVNAYQTNLNNGINKRSKKLNEQRTDFWSDFSKVTYKPSCIIKHPEYNYDLQSKKGISKNINTNLFLGHQLGIDSFHNVEEFENSVDDVIRKMFEDSNNINQINVVVELDSAWSGVCSESVKYIVDDQLNGKGGKVLVWSLQNDGNYVSGLNNVGKLDRIRKLIDLGNAEYGGFVTLNLNEVKGDNLWEKTGYLSIPFYFFNMISDSDISEVLYKLTDGGQRKFINEIKTLKDNETLNMGCKNIFTLNNSNSSEHIFAKSVVSAPDIDNEKLSQFDEFNKIIEKGTSKHYLQNLKAKDKFMYIDSLPTSLENSSIMASSLGVTSSIRDDFKNMSNFVSRYCHSNEREDLKDNLDNLYESYTFGFEFSDEEDDD